MFVFTSLFVVIVATGSPYKMSTTEQRVIGGLQQLTQLLFNNHFKHTADTTESINDKENAFIQSGEITSSNHVIREERPSTSCDSSIMDKENQGNFRMIFNDAHVGSEKFCAMVVKQIAHLDEYDDWHSTQLNAFAKTSGEFFEED